MKKNKADLKAAIEGELTNTSAKSVTPADLRRLMTDTVDTVFSWAQSLGPNTATTLTRNAETVSGVAGNLTITSGTWVDIDGDDVTLTASLGVVAKNTNGTWSWSHTPVIGDDGTVVTITANDGQAESTVTFTLDITSSNAAPTVSANSPTVVGTENTIFSMSGTWTDTDSQPAPVVLTASIGQIVRYANGTWDWTYTPTLGQDGTVVTITADDTEDTGQDTFSLVVNSNEAPQVDVDNSTVEIGANDQATNSGTWSDQDLNGITLTASVGSVTKNVDGTWDWSHTALLSEDGDTVTITADDGSTTSNTAFTLNVLKALYIDTTSGDDANSGLSPALAVQTPGQAAELAEDDSTFEAIYAKAGQTMGAAINAHDPATRLHSNSIRFDNLSNVIISTYGGLGIFTVDGFGAPSTEATDTPNYHFGLIDVRNPQTVTMRNWKAYRASHVGIAGRSRTVSDTADGIIFENCAVETTGGSGMILAGQDGGFNTASTLQNGVIRYCEIKDTCTNKEIEDQFDPIEAGGEAISVFNANLCEVHHNYLYDHHKEGIDMKQGVTNSKMYRNYLRDPFDGAYVASGTGVDLYTDAASNGVSDIEIYENVSIRGMQGVVVGAESGGDAERIQIHHNYIEDAIAQSINISGFGATGNKVDIDVENNTIDTDRAQHLIGINETDPAKLTNIAVRGNILNRRVASGIALMLNNAGTHTIDKNLLYNQGTSVGSVTGTNSVQSDPELESVEISTFWEDDPFEDNPAWTRPTVTAKRIKSDSPAFQAFGVTVGASDLFRNAVPTPESIGATQPSLVRADGRTSDGGNEVFRIENTTTRNSNLSSDFDSQSPTGAWMDLYDVTADKHYSVNVSTGEFRDQGGTGAGGGGSVRDDLIWHKTRDEHWMITNTTLDLTTLKGVVKRSITLPVFTTTPTGAVTGQTWRTGTRGDTIGFLTCVATTSGETHHWIQPFELEEGALLPGWWINDADPAEYRLHNPHPGTTKLFMFPSPGQSDFHVVNWDGSGWQELTSPQPGGFIHPTVQGEMVAWAGGSSGDEIHVYNYQDPVNPVLVRSIDVTDTIGGGSTFTQLQHGVLRPDGILLFSAIQGTTCIGLYKTDVNDPAGAIERIISLSSDAATFDWAPRPAGRSWISWNEGTDATNRKAYFVEV